MLEKLILTLSNKKYQLLTRPHELNIIGVRSSKALQNSFDDTIHIISKDDKGIWTIHSYPATTDPGTYWLINPMNLKGTAILQPGQYKNSHRIGVHRGKYQALVQQNPLRVWRDNDRNATLNWPPDKEDTGVFGINIHHASVNGTTKSVDKYSAGCQVLANINDFNELMKMAFVHKKLYGNNFTYTLINEQEIQ